MSTTPNAFGVLLESSQGVAFRQEISHEPEFQGDFREGTDPNYTSSLGSSFHSQPASGSATPSRAGSVPGSGTPPAGGYSIPASGSPSAPSSADATPAWAKGGLTTDQELQRAAAALARNPLANPGLAGGIQNVGANKGPGLYPLSSQKDNRYRLEALSMAPNPKPEKAQDGTENHRMGDYLAGAYYDFHSDPTNAGRDFFDWVEQKVKDHGAEAMAKQWYPGLFKPENQRWHETFVDWFAKGVKYVVGKEARERYQVSIGKDGTLSRRGFGENSAITDKFDSEELRKYHKEKGGQDRPIGECIWVLGEDGEFYAHLGKLGRFHHSSLGGAKHVAAAGEWTVKNGKLESIDGTTGHYRVPPEALISALEVLDKEGALSDKTKVVLYQKTGGKKEEVNAKNFLANPQSFLKTCNTYKP